MKKATVFECSECGTQYAKWQGRCLECGSWNTLFEVSIANTNSSNNIFKDLVTPIKLKDIKSYKYSRVKTGVMEFDRVLGGGFVSGQVVLLAGEPGIGKSTLLLQIAKTYKNSIYYICGEESPSQVKQRCDRLGLINVDLNFIENTFIETINSYVSNLKDCLIILDSINSCFSSKYKSYPGSMSNIRECSQLITATAKRLNLNLIIVGQVNKEGDVAGPKSLEHTVDTVLNLEGDNKYSFRVLRCIKNRFGSINETGIFLMEDSGMIEVPNPSKYLLMGKMDNTSGSSVCITLEGTRCLAVEIQALCIKSSFGFPKRVASGFNINRLSLLCAIIEKRLNLPVSQYDIYLNVASGINLKEPAVDLAVCASIVSSIKNKPLLNNSSFFGEVGLNGEVRPVTMTKLRINESNKMKYPNLFYSETVANIFELLNKALLK